MPATADDGVARSEGSPVLRTLVAAGVALEALLMAGFAVSVAVTSAVGSAQDRVGAAFLALTAVVLAAGLTAVAVGIHRGARWARSPALVWQILQVLVATTTLPLAARIPLVVLGVAVGYGVMRRDVLPFREVTPPR